MAQAITKGHPNYQRLLDLWIKEKEPENLMVGTLLYQVIKPSDDEVVFIPQGGFDETYGSHSPIPGSN